jgi:hypothetical protein
LLGDVPASVRRLADDDDPMLLACLCLFLGFRKIGGQKQFQNRNGLRHEIEDVEM